MGRRCKAWSILINSSLSRSLCRSNIARSLDALQVGLATYLVSQLQRHRTEQSRLAHIFAAAEEYTISPLSIYLELKNYAKAHDESFTEIDSKRLHPEITGFNKRFPTLSEFLFDGDLPTADQFMRVAQEQFGTDFFKAFAQYIRERQPNPNTIAGILSVSPMDARAYQDALSA